MSAFSTESVYFLLVDDLEENLIALQALLNRDGLVLLKARSGVEALELLLKYDIALALLDVQMPGMDGFELAECMRGAMRTSRVPIIFLTAGSADLQRRFRGYEAGAVDFIQKPIEPDILKSKTQVFFDLYRQRDELRIATEENARLLNETQAYALALQDADRRKDEFLATLAHELRNPLALIRNGVNLLRRAPSNSEIAVKAVEMMDRQLGHMVRLIDDLLDVSRITSGKITLEKERVSLQAVAELALETSRPQIEAGGHELQLRFDENPLWVYVDVTRFSQVLSNLLTNAAKYTSERGLILLSLSRNGPTAVVEVSDSGLGIPKEMQSEIFVMFTQVNRTLDRAQGGLGIGLALVKRIVEMHEGTIEVESPGLGKGSTFRVQVPIMDDLDQQKSCSLETKSFAVPTRIHRILIVDDNEDAAVSLSLMLELSGHKTRVAYTGMQALEIAIDFLPELIFLDIGLPGMSGYEVAHALRADERTNKSIIIALTGWGSEEDRQRSQASGFNVHLTKPIQSDQVNEVLLLLETNK